MQRATASFIINTTVFEDFLFYEDVCEQMFVFIPGIRNLCRPVQRVIVFTPIHHTKYMNKTTTNG